MRRLMWFAIGFVAACITGVYLSLGIWLLIAALFSLPCAIVLWRGVTPNQKRTAFALWGCTVCFLWLYAYDSVYLSAARNADQNTEAINVEITDYSFDLGYGTATEGKIKIDGKTYRVCIYLDDDRALVPGNQVQGEFRLRYTPAGGAQKETYHQGKGIFLLAYGEEITSVTFTEPGRFQCLGARLRHKITQLLDAVFPADVLGFARALLLGDSSLLTYGEESAFRLSGLRHIIAVSGLHVSILFSLVYLLAVKSRGLTALIGIPVLLLFASVAGFTPSITRACIMQGLMILAMLLKREYDPPTALSFAVVAMLLINPRTITSVSFQLSAACMVGIFLFSRRICNYFLDEKRFGPAMGSSFRARMSRFVWGSVSVTLGAMITTTPLCAWYFGCVSLVSILSNLLTLWVVSFIFYGIMLAGAVGALWLPAGKAVAWCVGWPIRYVLLTAKTLSAFPLAAVYVCSAYIVLWIVLCYVLLAAFFLMKDKRPMLFAACVLTALVFSVGASHLEGKPEHYRLTLLNVGQGQCILLQNKTQCYLVDCGGDTPETAADLAGDYLLSMGITHLDGIIVTHYDTDHTSGIPLLLTRISADRLYLPNVEDTGLSRERLVSCKQNILWIEPDTVLTVPEADITVFAAEAGKTDNESSLCILFQPENCDILITGDRSVAGERALLAKTALPELEVFIAGHHGGATSSGRELLEKTSPAVVLISVGENNSFGHPSPKTLQRLEEYGCKICRTDLEGTIIIGG